MDSRLCRLWHSVRLTLARGSRKKEGVVTKSAEPNSVYAGIPAKKIGTFTESANKRRALEEAGLIATVARNQSITAEEIQHAWDVFGLNTAKGVY